MGSYSIWREREGVHSTNGVSVSVASKDCWSQKSSRMDWKIHGEGGKMDIYHKNTTWTWLRVCSYK